MHGFCMPDETTKFKIPRTSAVALIPLPRILKWFRPTPSVGGMCTNSPYFFNVSVLRIIA